MSSGGITDEAAMEGHDLIERAEREEEELHKNDKTGSWTGSSQGANLGGMSSSTDKKTTGQKDSSTMDKVKEKLNLK